MRTAFVTGGSGFVGGRLIESLVADGWTVRALARSDAAAERIGARGGQAVRGELGDVSALTAGGGGGGRGGGGRGAGGAPAGGAGGPGGGAGGGGGPRRGPPPACGAG